MQNFAVTVVWKALNLLPSVTFFEFVRAVAIQHIIFRG